MNKNKIIFYVTIAIILLLIAITSIIKTINTHNNRLIEATTKKIVEAAKNCYYNESCINDTITLQELYEKTDLKDLVNPITKKKYNTDSYVDVKNNFEFVEKE